MKNFVNKAKEMFDTMKDFLVSEGEGVTNASSTKPTSFDEEPFLITVNGDWSSGDEFSYVVKDASKQIIETGTQEDLKTIK